MFELIEPKSSQVGSQLESDDWEQGSVRYLASRATYFKKGFHVDKPLLQELKHCGCLFGDRKSFSSIEEGFFKRQL